jgi:hypothetical protein
MLTPTQLDELEAKLKAATPQPWRHDGVGPDVHGAVHHGRVVRASEQFMDRKLRIANAALTCAAVNSLPALISDAREAGELRAWLDDNWSRNDCGRVRCRFCGADAETDHSLRHDSDCPYAELKGNDHG